jgi:CheY-like chemotaxis protein
VRQAARRILERFGYRVLPAPGGSEALQILEAERGPVHLLLTDVVMPGMDGRELADAVQKARPATKVLFMSGYASGHITAHEVLQDGLHFIGKPFEPEALARKVRDLLDAERAAATAS